MIGVNFAIYPKSSPFSFAGQCSALWLCGFFLPLNISPRNDRFYTIYGWTKKDGQLPSSIELKKIADVLDVDTAFLLGEQVCQRNADQTICNVTELNETSAKLLSGLNGVSADMMNELLNHKDFDRLILLAWDYTHSHNKEVTITNILDNSKDLPLVHDTQREMMKYRAVDTFGKILDDIYDAHQQEDIYAKIAPILIKMEAEITEYIKYKNEPEARPHLPYPFPNLFRI